MAQEAMITFLIMRPPLSGSRSDLDAANKATS
jgi:hypothetical protein